MTLKQAQEEGAESMQLVELLINHCEDVRTSFLLLLLFFLPKSLTFFSLCPFIALLLSV